MYKTCFILIASMFSTSLAFAEMPKELRGTWVLDAQATEKNILSSPKLKANDKKYLPTILKRMSKYVWEFSGSAITATRGTKENTLPVALKENNKKTYVFEGQMNDQTILMTVTFVSGGVINIVSSETDDMKYYLWKRGQLDLKTKKDNDASLAIELMEKSLNNPPNEKGASDGN